VTLKAMDVSLRRALKVPVPAELLVIAAGIAAVYWLNLDGTPLSATASCRLSSA
jgi:hypothetical protein